MNETTGTPTPPPGVPAPARPPAPALGTTASGLDPRFAAMLAYLIGWVTGLLFYFLERDNRFVRFHAVQSIAALGALWALGVSFWILGFLSVFVSAAAFRVLMWLAELTWIAATIVWLICLYKAYSGERWKLPVAGDIADRASRA
jgi:uncharacterized membrane protein